MRFRILALSTGALAAALVLAGCAPTDGSWDSVGAATGTVQALGNADGAVVLVDNRGIVWIHGTETTVVLPAGTAQ
ncbi:MULTISPECIES: hypothetical protein [Gordonia]|uniref:hypothetical protein n=1 Tax=Gordonia TaxID=2053 RepID=UPI0004AFD821|nr:MULTISPECIES: hypothetical protein [Gordonia]KSU51699.1 hypothetical protein AS181_23690 [Gordonia sp. SGD-V-85]MBA5846886.1 hypothetical protein [Gordonia amicalis]WJG15580.1 hypothetical protein PWF70_11585 [Gordonia sp. Swx-4]SCC59577.1 hypothetical protein GA0061091_13611 [Gordonia sp. v-85]